MLLIIHWGKICTKNMFCSCVEKDGFVKTFSAAFADNSTRGGYVRDVALRPRLGLRMMVGTRHRCTRDQPRMI